MIKEGYLTVVDTAARNKSELTRVDSTGEVFFEVSYNQPFKEFYHGATDNDGTVIAYTWDVGEHFVECD